MRSCVIKYWWRLGNGLCIMAPQGTRLNIPPRSSTAAMRLHDPVQQTLRDS